MTYTGGYTRGRIRDTHRRWFACCGGVIDTTGTTVREETSEIRRGREICRVASVGLQKRVRHRGRRDPAHPLQQFLYIIHCRGTANRTTYYSPLCAERLFVLSVLRVRRGEKMVERGTARDGSWLECVRATRGWETRSSGETRARVLFKNNNNRKNTPNLAASRVHYNTIVSYMRCARAFHVHGVVLRGESYPYEGASPRRRRVFECIIIPSTTTSFIRAYLNIFLILPRVFSFHHGFLRRRSHVTYIRLLKYWTLKTARVMTRIYRYGFTRLPPLGKFYFAPH